VPTYPNNRASYSVSVRQYRILPFGFLHCCRRRQPACHLLILQGVTPAYKGFTPSGKIHLLFLVYVKFICIFKLFQQLTASALLLMQGAHITYTQAGVSCFVGQVSAKFEVQFFVGNSVVKTLPAYS
jgi:hypothetical protein